MCGNQSNPSWCSSLTSVHPHGWWRRLRSASEASRRSDGLFENGAWDVSESRKSANTKYDFLQFPGRVLCPELCIESGRAGAEHLQPLNPPVLPWSRASIQSALTETLATIQSAPTELLEQKLAVLPAGCRSPSKLGWYEVRQCSARVLSTQSTSPACKRRAKQVSNAVSTSPL